VGHSQPQTVNFPFARLSLVSEAVDDRLTTRLGRQAIQPSACGRAYQKGKDEGEHGKGVHRRENKAGRKRFLPAAETESVTAVTANRPTMCSDRAREKPP
jgi:hypothetical protein